MVNWKEVKVGEDGEMWDKDSVLIGSLVKVEQDIGPNKSKMYTVKTKDGDVKFWGSTVLDDKLMGVPVGSQVKVEYEGKVAGKRGEYNSYKVFVDVDVVPEAKQDVTETEISADEQSLIDSIPF